MGRFPTGVTVVASTARDGTPVGLTVNSFTSVSLDPPLVLVCIDRGSSSHDPIVEGGGFAVSILADDQEKVARRFAFDPSETRFDAVGWRPSGAGSPVLDGSAAWVDCRLEEIIPAGDHSILLGHVIESGVSDREPLVFHGGNYGGATT